MSPFDIAKNINSHGNPLDVESDGIDKVDYKPYMMNKIFANAHDSIFFANEMNKSHFLDEQLQYDFYRYGLDKNPRRYGKWMKKYTGDDDFIALIQKIYDYSRDKAIEVMPILLEKRDILESFVYEGGVK